MLAFRAAVLRENFAESGGALAALLLPWRHMWYLYALVFWHLTLPVLCRLRTDSWGWSVPALAWRWPWGWRWLPGWWTGPSRWCGYLHSTRFMRAGCCSARSWTAAGRVCGGHRPVRLVWLRGLVLGYGAYFHWVRADPIMDHSAELFHDVSYAGGDRVQYRVVFYLVGIATTAALTVLASRWHLLAGLGRHTLAIYLLHLPVQALLVELGL